MVGCNDTHNKMHWVNKETLFKPKAEGGMGFRILSYFNQVMLAKQVLRIHTNPETLLAKC
jgi:hypothetical protein